jgi:hypothetical protein
MTVREIQSHSEEMYGAEVSPTLISSVTDAVMDEAKARQARPLEALYPIVYPDCIHVKTREAGLRLKYLPSCPRSFFRGHDARLSHRIQYGISGRIPSSYIPA